jgi:hypothetical protein
MSTFGVALRFVEREFEFFGQGEAYRLAVMAKWPSNRRYENLQRLSDNVLTALRREMPDTNDRLRVIFRDHLMDPWREKIERII